MCEGGWRAWSPARVVMFMIYTKEVVIVYILTEGGEGGGWYKGTGQRPGATSCS